MADCVHAPMEDVQPAAGDPVVDDAVRQPEREELGSGDDPSPARRELTDAPVASTRVAFATHEVV
jgi:hypothetical protein